MTIAVGDTFHLRSPMTIAFSEHDSRSLQRGTTVVVTEELLEMSKDRAGNSWLDLVDDPAAQVQRYGSQKFARGECPPEVTWWNENPGDGAWNYARQLEEDRIGEISLPEDRARAAEEVRKLYGRKNGTTTLSSWGTRR